MTQSPGILFVNDASAYGGAELYQTELARACLARGWRAAVAMPADERLDGWRESLSADGIEVMRYAKHDVDDGTLTEKVGRWEAYLVHANCSSQTGFFRTMAAVKNGRPCVLTEHLFPYYIPLTCSWWSRLRTWRHRRIWREKWSQWKLSERIITVNEIYRKVMIANWAAPAERITAVHNGVDPDAFASRESARKKLFEILGREVTEPIILATGRMEWQKGFDYLLKALAGLKERRWFLVMVGGGAFLAELQARVNAMGLSDRVHFTGHREDLKSFLAGGDLFVLPSRNEAIGFSLLEAMACGVASIGTVTGGVPEVLGCSEYGLLVPPENVSALGQAIGRLLDGSRLREAFGEKARSRILSKFTRRQMIDRTLTIYDEMV